MEDNIFYEIVKEGKGSAILLGLTLLMKNMFDSFYNQLSKTQKAIFSWSSLAVMLLLYFGVAAFVVDYTIKIFRG